MIEFYPIKSIKDLEKYLEAYVPLVSEVAKSLSINIKDQRFAGDHLGLQVLSKEEFDTAHRLLLDYCALLQAEEIHNRRNNVYRFNNTVSVAGVTFAGIEIFEPKPEADLKKLKPGIEHMAFCVKDYDTFINECKNSSVPIDKIDEKPDGSKFFKTGFVNLVEIEFRNNFLGD